MPTRRLIAGILLMMVAEAVRSHGNGGTLLVVPRLDDSVGLNVELDRRATITPSLTKCLDHYTAALEKGTPAQGEDALFDHIATAPALGDLHHYLTGQRHRVNDALLRLTDAVGRLSAIDGAVVLDWDLAVISFGAVIKAPEVMDVTKWSILDRDHMSIVPVKQLGGTRRQSAARFVCQGRDYVAITASHDGPMTIATWILTDPPGPAVHVVGDIECMLE